MTPIEADLAIFLAPPRTAVHPTGILRWAHFGSPDIKPHSHYIGDSWGVHLKNDMAEHIEIYHKVRRSSASK